MKGEYTDPKANDSAIATPKAQPLAKQKTSAKLTKKQKAALAEAQAVPDVTINDTEERINLAILDQATELRDQFYADEDAVVTDRVNEIMPSVIQHLVNTSPDRVERKTRDAAREVAEDWQEKFRDYSEKLDARTRESSAELLRSFTSEVY